MSSFEAGLTRVVDSRAMQEIDRRAQEEFGTPALVLMESAGLLGWLELRSRLGEPAVAEPGRARSGPKLCFLAGKGNNGGDALVMARYALRDGYQVTIVLAATPGQLGEQARLHARIIEAQNARVLVWSEQTDACRSTIASAHVIVDGLAGTGIKGALRSPLDAMCAAANDSAGEIVAVDAPSGLSDQWRSEMPAVRAKWTLTMGLPKTCLYAPSARPLCGEIIRIGVSFPPQLTSSSEIHGVLLEPRDLGIILPPISDEAYKHRRGVVGVFAGSVGTTGAAVLAAEGAQRCRAGLVTIYADDEIYPIVASTVKSVMARRRMSIAALGDTALDAVVVGPGWGVTPERRSLLNDLLSAIPKGVIDADGLNLLAGMDSAPSLSEEWVLTPHPGELARLLDRSTGEVRESFLASVRELAARSGAVVVGKSNVTMIARPDGRFAIVDGMNPALGTGGTGDVLAGAIAGLLAGGMSGWQAACAGTLAHQMAGRSLRDRSGIFLAEELPAELGRVVDVRTHPQR